MVIAASLANLIAHNLLCKWSYTFNWLDSATSPFSILSPLAYFKLAEVNLVITSLTLYPAFSIKILGIISKDLAYLSNEY